MQLFEYNNYGFQDNYHKTYKIIQKIKDDNLEFTNRWFCIHNDYVNRI